MPERSRKRKDRKAGKEKEKEAALAKQKEVVLMKRKLNSHLLSKDCTNQPLPLLLLHDCAAHAKASSSASVSQGSFLSAWY